MTARTAVGLRRLLAILAWGSDTPGATVVAALFIVVAAIAVMDLAYLLLRRT